MSGRKSNRHPNSLLASRRHPGDAVGQRLQLFFDVLGDDLLVFDNEDFGCGHGGPSVDCHLSGNLMVISVPRGVL